MIILNEKQYAQKCIADNDIGEKPYRTLSILAKYYYFSCGYKKKQISDLLTEFLQRNYIEYIGKQDFWDEQIEKIVSKVNKKTLYEISGVKITKSEMQKIQSLNNRLLEKLLFSMLCVAKYYNLKNEKNNGWVNLPDKDMLKLANINCSTTRINGYINALYQKHLLDLPWRCDVLNYRVTFIDDNEEEIFVSDFRNLGYEYLLYCGENYIRCAECGILTIGNTNRTKKYCSKCKSYSKVKPQLKYCICCGETFVCPSNVATKVRCNTCQAVYNSENKKKWRQKQA